MNQYNDKRSKINLFKEYGYVNFEEEILRKFDVDFLDKESAETYTNLSESHDDFIKDSGTEGFINLPAHNKNSLKILDSVVTHPKIISFLKEIIGSDYKIWDISYRVSKPGDNGLYLHQDGPGQLNMAILLNDNKLKNGNTAFLSSSHLIAKSQKSLKLEVPPLILNMFSFLFDPLYGKRGDIFFFSNKTWHGRFANKSHKENKLIFIAFFPKGYRYNRPWSDDVLERSKNLAINSLLPTKNDYKDAVDSSCELREQGKIYNHKDHKFTINIESDNYLKNNTNIGVILKTKVIFLKFLMIVILFIRKGYK